MDKYQDIIDQCEVDVKSFQSMLTESGYTECIEYVLTHNEWLLGLVYAIDWLAEDNQEISENIFKQFEKAYIMMNLEGDVRLQDLKNLIN